MPNHDRVRASADIGVCERLVLRLVRDRRRRRGQSRGRKRRKLDSLLAELAELELLVASGHDESRRSVEGRTHVRVTELELHDRDELNSSGLADSRDDFGTDRKSVV